MAFIAGTATDASSAVRRGRRRRGGAWIAVIVRHEKTKRAVPFAALLTFCWMNSVLLLASTQESSRPATRGADDGRRGSSWSDALHRPPVPVGRGSGAVRPSQVASQHPVMLLVGAGTFCGVAAAV